MTRISGIIPPICTPLDAEGAVDTASLERLVERLLAAGVHGIFALGSTGEAIYLDDAKRERVLDVVVGACAGSVPVFAGALEATPARVIGQLRWIERYPVEAVVVTAPFYADTSPTETTRHFELIAAATDKPVLAYDIPGNVGRKLRPDIVMDLLERSVVAGLKDSSGDMDDFAAILAAVGPDRSSSILTGSDVRAAESLARGADGIVPGVANVVPALLVALYDAHLSGDEAALHRAQDEVTAVTGLFGIGAKHGTGLHASQMGGLKFVLHRDGVIDCPRLSEPLTPYPPEAEAELAGLLESLGR